MNAVEKKITIEDLISGFVDNDESGVHGYGGKLNIRPPYQREFVYNTDQQVAVIESIKSGMPLNVMYWADNGDGTYELIDGQQRTMSICNFFKKGSFSVNYQFWHNLEKEDLEELLKYEITVYVCSGKQVDKLRWFRTINIAGEKLTDQELRNSVYTGTWLSSAKSFFSSSNCVAYNMGKHLVKGSPIRQELLETALLWAADGGSISEYMAKNQLKENANELWEYYQKVIRWVDSVFTVSREKEMKGIPWGFLYNKYHKNYYDSTEVEKEIAALMVDEDVTKLSGAYMYFFTRDPRHLNIRAFDQSTKRRVYETQKGICPHCEKNYKITEMEADHITPWVEGGKTAIDNCQVLCKACNRKKSNK